VRVNCRLHRIFRHKILQGLSMGYRFIVLNGGG
jgi:hypothetical protein